MSIFLWITLIIIVKTNRFYYISHCATTLTNVCNKYGYDFLLFGLLKSANNVTIFIQSVRSIKANLKTDYVSCLCGFSIRVKQVNDTHRRNLFPICHTSLLSLSLSQSATTGLHWLWVTFNADFEHLRTGSKPYWILRFSTENRVCVDPSKHGGYRSLKSAGKR